MFDEMTIRELFAGILASLTGLTVFVKELRAWLKGRTSSDEEEVSEDTRQETRQVVEAEMFELYGEHNAAMLPKNWQRLRELPGVLLSVDMFLVVYKNCVLLQNSLTASRVFYVGFHNGARVRRGTSPEDFKMTVFVEVTDPGVAPIKDKICDMVAHGWHPELGQLFGSRTQTPGAEVVNVPNPNGEVTDDPRYDMLIVRHDDVNEGHAIKRFMNSNGISCMTISLVERDDNLFGLAIATFDDNNKLPLCGGDDDIDNSGQCQLYGLAHFATNASTDIGNIKHEHPKHVRRGTTEVRRHSTGVFTPAGGQEDPSGDQ